MNRLAQVRMTKRTNGFYLGRVIGPDPQPKEQDAEPEASAARQQVTANFDHPMQRLGTARTAWSAVNAVSQYVDWERPTRGALATRDKRRSEAILLGLGPISSPGHGPRR